MASRKEYEMLFQLNAQLGGTFSGTFSKAQQQLASMQKEIQALSKTQSDIAAYQKQQSAVEATRSKLAVLQQQYDNIQKEIKETEGYSSSLENKLLTKQQQIEKTSASLKDQTSKLETMGNALKDAGVDTDNLSKESAELSTKMNDLKKKQEEVADGARKYGTASVDALEAAKSALMAAGLAKAYKEISEEIIECVKASIEFESAITGVFKTVDGTDEQLAEITQGIKDMSTEIPATTTEIASVAEAAGQLGIATDDVLAFTRVMIDLGESTNLSADDAASSLAKFANITGTSADNYSRLGSVVVDLGNNFATTEADIVAMSTRLASAGTISGLTEAEIMALATAMSSVGIEAEAGGTAMAQTLNAIETAVATQSAELTEFARIAGMTAAEFSSAWNSNPIEALQAFIAGLGGLDAQGESTVLVLEKLGLTGIRQSNMLKSLGLAADTLGDSIQTANKAWDENTALTIEAGKRYATTESQLKMLRNSYGNLQVAIGDVFTPTLAELSEVGADVLDSITEFVENNPEFVKAVTALGIGVGAFTVALVGYIAVSKIAKAATDALTASMKANPYLLAGSAIIGLVAALGSLATMAGSTEPKVEKLTASSEKQQAEIEALEKEYKALCDAGKETSEEAYYLEYRIESLTDSFEGQKQTLEEYIARSKELNEAWNDSLDTNRESVEEIETNEGRTLALISRLSELASQTDKTAASQEEMKAIIAELNELLPGVAFNYDDVKDGLGEIEELLKNEATAQSNLAKAEQARKSMMNADAERAAAQKHLEDLNKQYEAEKKVNAELKERRDKLQADSNFWVGSGGRGTNPYEASLKEAKAAYKASNEALESYKTQISETTDTLNQATADYDSYLKTIVETSGITIESIDSMNALDEAIASASLSMQSLASTYTLAYTLAKESFEGQYGLFDQAQADMEATVGSAQRALDSQLKFWQTYADNVNVLRGVSAEDLGVTQENYNEIMAYAQSGTEEAAGFAASLRQAVDSGNTEAITKLANTVGEVKAAREKAAGEVAAWQVDFDGQMKQIISTMETSLQEMDMSEEAIEAAKSTMTSYADTISTQGATAVANALSIANQVRTALQSASTTINIGVTGNGKTGTGYAMGTENATPGWHLVGENGPEIVYFGGGETVYTADETRRMLNGAQEEMQIVSFLPLFQNYIAAMGAISATNRVEPVGAYGKSGGQYTITIAPQLTVQGGASDDIDSKFQEFSDIVVGNVMDALEEAGIDAKRGAYV